MGRRFKREGTYVHPWLIRVDVWQKTTKFYKAIILQLKISKFLKKRLFSSLLSAIRVMSSAYLRLLIFLPAILIPACASSSPAFLMMYSAAAAAKSLQSCPTLCNPTDSSPPGSSVLGFSRQEHWSGLPFDVLCI